MATLELSVRRLILAGGFAVAVAAAPAIAVVTVGSASAAPVAQCPAGEEEDLYTGACVPHTVPNSGAAFSSIPGNPSLPAVDGIPCTGHNSGQCIGLAEESEAMGPQPEPRSTVSSSP
ncbi:intersectin-EH binding protein Ibp1 [Mycobacterium sp. NPDC048908]|uniref:intersectin-EH binding protein Ibp1 n=1 Tax=Mycobacterium sp. NPDC048908 TaxID=3364292 RepID=UPI00371EBB60